MNFHAWVVSVRLGPAVGTACIQMAASDPSWNTDQGVQHACESLGD